MRELPRGTVTLLFTDIEGSTRLLHELGDGYAEVLADHRRVLREAFGKHGGVEVDTQGDAFFYAFASATDAVAAAEEAQQALAEGLVRVRIGLHTSEPRLTDEGYVGAAVHRAARIMSAGHGGQVVVSEATRRLLDSRFELRDLGEHRLKDLDAPERLFQIGDSSFPPLRSLNNTNVPLQLEPLVGRKRELADLVRLVRRDGIRLVTLTGPGGIGKTRLALELGAEIVADFAHGVWFVDLAAIREPHLVAPTITGVLGAKDDLREHVGDRSLGLVLDNFEQVIEAGAELALLLAACANLVVVATSREPLRIGGESVYSLRPLAEAPAVELFRQRATAAAPDFDASYSELADVCARVDFLPLAIELAAARAKTLTPSALRLRLERRLPLLSKGRRDAPERQRTLRATIDWSYELLSPGEQKALARLAVFAGGWTLAAAEAACDVDVEMLDSLVDKSLVRHRNGRYSMLETIREYALERLAELGQAEETQRRHGAYYLELAERIEAGRPREDRYEEFEAIHDNMRAALAHFAATEATESELRLILALEKFWLVRGFLDEGNARIDAALARARHAPAALRASVHASAADFARLRGDTDGGLAHAEASLRLARELDDADLVTRALHELGETAQAAGEYDRAEGAFREAIETATAAGRTADGALANLGDLALARGEFEQALAHSQEALRRFRAKEATAEALVAEFNVGAALFHLGRVDEARQRFRACLDDCTRIGFADATAWCILAAAAVAAEAGDADAAQRLVAGADALLGRVHATLGAAERELREHVLGRVGSPSPEAREWAERDDDVRSLARECLG
jgi:predicted ATPase